MLHFRHVAVANKLEGRRYRPNVDLPEPCMNSYNVCNMMYGMITNNTRGDLTVDTDTRHSVRYRPYNEFIQCMNSYNVCNMMYGMIANNTRGDLTVDTYTAQC